MWLLRRRAGGSFRLQDGGLPPPPPCARGALGVGPLSCHVARASRPLSHHAALPGAAAVTVRSLTLGPWFSVGVSWER